MIEKYAERLGAFKQVVPVHTSNGNQAKDQFDLYFENAQVFQSYASIICIIFDDPDEKIVVGDDWDYSRTTAKYRKEFMRGNKKEIELQIKNGDIILDKTL